MRLYNLHVNIHAGARILCSVTRTAVDSTEVQETVKEAVADGGKSFVDSGDCLEMMLHEDWHGQVVRVQAEINITPFRPV